MGYLQTCYFRTGYGCTASIKRTDERPTQAGSPPKLKSREVLMPRQVLPPVCRCGVFAIGSCLPCGAFVCSLHSFAAREGGALLCEACASKDVLLSTQRVQAEERAEKLKWAQWWHRVQSATKDPVALALSSSLRQTYREPSLAELLTHWCEVAQQLGEKATRLGQRWIGGSAQMEGKVESWEEAYYLGEAETSPDYYDTRTDVIPYDKAYVNRSGQLHVRNVRHVRQLARPFRRPVYERIWSGCEVDVSVPRIWREICSRVSRRLRLEGPLPFSHYCLPWEVESPPPGQPQSLPYE